jgi:predicted RNase H-like HicB family nuclease
LKENELHKFRIVIEKAKNNYSAYSPDLPGCVATGATLEEVEELMHEAIDLQIRGIAEKSTLERDLDIIDENGDFIPWEDAKVELGL